MKKIFTVAVIFIFNIVNAQSWLWTESANGAGTDAGRKVAADNSGNVYVVGGFGNLSISLGTVTINNTNSTTQDIYVAKYSSTGTLIWAQRIGGDEGEFIKDICTDAAGSLYLTGTYTSTLITIGSSTLTNTGTPTTTDVFVAKYNGSGTVQWAKRIFGSKSENSGGLAIVSNTLIVGGDYNSASIQVGSSLTTTLVNTDATATKYDVFMAGLDVVNGGTSWIYTTGGINSDDKVTDLDVDATGNRYVLGTINPISTTTSVIGSTTLTTTGGNDAFVVKYTSAGAFSWAIKAGSNGGDTPTGIVVDGSGNSYFTGYSSATFSIGAIGITNSGLFDGFVAKLNTSGALQWLNKVGSNFNENLSDITRDNANNIYVGGYFSSNSLTVGASTVLNASQNPTLTTSNDNLVLKYNTSGSLQWMINSGNANSEFLYGISSDAIGNVYVTGAYSFSNTVIGTTTLTSAGSSDAFLTKISCLTPTITGNATICAGSSATLTVTGATNYSWSTGATTTSIVITPSINTTYTVFGVTGLCSNTSSDFSVVVMPASINAGSDLSLLCKEKQKIITTFTPGITSVNWVPSTGLSNASVSSPTVIATAIPITYVVTATLTNGCVVNDNVNVSSTAPTPDICSVSTDSISKYNHVIWNKTSYPTADSFIVYREVSSSPSTYLRIGAQKYSAPSRFTDTARSIGPANGNPNISSYRYKLQIRDSCANYSLLSPFHNSIFFVSNLGTYTWNQYTIQGLPNPVTTYDLFRDNNATGTWTLIGSCAGSQTTLNDPQASLYPNAIWRVDANGFNCNPTLKSSPSQQVNKSKSNIKNNLNAPVELTGITTYEINNNVNIAPNPAIDELIVLFNDELNTKTTLIITDVLGKVVYTQLTSNEKKVIVNINGMTSGIYFLTIQQGNAKAVKNFVKE